MPTRHVDKVLLLLSAASGVAALIYEIVFFQLVEFIVGSSAISLGVLLATFMGGLCIGSLALPRLVAGRHHPLRVFAAIELAIGCIGVLVPLVMPLVTALYTTGFAQALPSELLRIATCVVLLLPPTILMGATLPIVARWMDGSADGSSRVGRFYAANIAGATFGCLLAGFYLLRVYDMMITSYVAVALNGTVALISVLLATMAPYEPASQPAVETVPADASDARAVYLTIALSGVTALGAEVIWTRVLALLFGATVYTFSLILAVFLFGMGAGSSVGSYLVRHVGDSRAALGKCQLLLAVSIAWAAYMIGGALPYWPVNPPLAPSPWFNFQIDLFSAAAAILPAAFFWGASFPFALAAAARGSDAGRATSAVYAANTIGAIVGALAFSMVLFPWFGAQRVQQLLILLSAAAALVALMPVLSRRRQAEAAEPARRPVSPAFAAVALVILAALMSASVPGVPDKLTAYGRRMLLAESGKVLYRGDGRVSSIAVTERNMVRSFHVSGRSEASTAIGDMRLERMLGHLSAMLHPKPRSVLIVGFGAGITAGTFVLYPEIERIVICEIEPLIPENIGPYFRRQNYDVLRDPRVTVVYDDARHYVLTTPEKFDVITSDPIHPWVKGSASLYTQEYFEMVKRRLNPGGVVTQWVPLYESTSAAVKSEIATFFKVFSDGAVWSNQLAGVGSDVVLSGHATPSPVDVDALTERTNRPDYRRVMDSLREVKFTSLTDLLASYIGQQSDLAGWLAGAEMNTDRNLRVQYLAGMGALNLQDDMSPDDALREARSTALHPFVGSAANLDALRNAIQSQSPRSRGRPRSD